MSADGLAGRRFWSLVAARRPALSAAPRPHRRSTQPVPAPAMRRAASPLTSCLRPR